MQGRFDITTFVDTSTLFPDKINFSRLGHSWGQYSKNQSLDNLIDISALFYVLYQIKARSLQEFIFCIDY